MLVLNTKDWEKIGQYSGNPFLDAMVDMQGLFSTVSTYYKHKPYIDKYSDTSLSDLKDKVKAYIPEAINQDGSINFSKLEELANQGNEMAESIVGIKQARENFANASIGGKLETFTKPDLQPQLDILSGNILTKEAKVLRNQKEIEEKIKNSNLPEDVKTIMLLSKGALFKDPQTLAAFLPYLSMLREQQPSNQQSSNQQTSDQQSSNQQFTQDDTSQSPTIEQFINNPFKPLDYINFTTADNTSSQTPTSEADYIKSIIENNLQKLPPQKRKQVIHKLKQAVETKKKQTQKTNKNNQSDIDINNPLKPLGDVSLQTQQQTSSTQPKPKKAKSTNNRTVLKIFKDAVYNPSSPNPNMFKPIGNIINHSTPQQPYIHPYIPSILDDSVLGKVFKRIFNSD